MTHFPAAGMAVLIIEDLVSRKWISHVVSSEETHTQVQLGFEQALDAEGLLEPALERAEAIGRSLDLDGEDQATPILLAVSDNGSQMIAGDTRKFMAMVAIAQHFGRPATPTDQAWIESLNGTLKAEWPHLNVITEPAVLRAELDLIRAEYNTSAAVNDVYSTRCSSTRRTTRSLTAGSILLRHDAILPDSKDSGIKPMAIQGDHPAQSGQRRWNTSPLHRASRRRRSSFRLHEISTSPQPHPQARPFSLLTPPRSGAHRAVNLARRFAIAGASLLRSPGPHDPGVPAARHAAHGHEAVIVSHQLSIWTPRRSANSRRLWHDPRRRECTLASLTTLSFAADGSLVGVDYSEPAASLLPLASKVVGA